MEASWTYYGKPGAQTSCYWECSFNAGAWALEEKLAKNRLLVRNFWVNLGAAGQLPDTWVINAGALGVSGGDQGCFWEAARKVARSCANRSGRCLGDPWTAFLALAGWAMGGSYRVAAPVKPAGEQLQATSFTWTEFGCLC